MNYKTFRNNLEEIGLDRDEIKEVIQRAENCDTDFVTGDYRIIDDHYIADIYYDEMIDSIKDCYDLDVPDFIEIDWDKTVENCMIDGYGHHFASYDGHEHHSEGYYIFKTN